MIHESAPYCAVGEFVMLKMESYNILLNLVTVTVNAIQIALVASSVFSLHFPR